MQTQSENKMKIKMSKADYIEIQQWPLSLTLILSVHIFSELTVYCRYQTTTTTTTVAEFPRLALANNLKLNDAEQRSRYYEPPTNIHN